MNSIASVIERQPPKQSPPQDMVQFYYDTGEFYYSIGKSDEGDRCFALARAEAKKSK